MNQAEIIAMATEAGLNSYRIAPGEAVAAWGRFAALVAEKAAAKEREACVRLVEAVKHCEQDPLLGAPFIARAINECADDLAAAIRARGQKGGV